MKRIRVPWVATWLWLVVGLLGAAAAGEISSDTAIASCKIHVERLLVGSAETTFGKEADLHVQPLGGDFEVSGSVTSKLPTGLVRHGDFKCRAQHSSGSLWTTKTELAIDP